MSKPIDITWCWVYNKDNKRAERQEELNMTDFEKCKNGVDANIRISFKYSKKGEFSIKDFQDTMEMICGYALAGFINADEHDKLNKYCGTRFLEQIKEPFEIGE